MTNLAFKLEWIISDPFKNYWITAKLPLKN